MRNWVLVLVAAGVVVLAGNAEAAKKPLKGTITKVEKDSGTETGTITVNVEPNKKKNPDAKPEEKKFKISDSTKLESVTGKKKDTTSTTAKFSDLAEGKTVAVDAGKGKKNKGAQGVKIFASKKKKKTKATT
ncbi:MAG: hypothetical protein RL595_521 [Planctomycetota bacterium]|jgi:N-acetylmuramoyl-L-alanine amidase